jgi:hypothetical protein
MPQSPAPATVKFIAGPYIDKPYLFVGRQDEIASIINNMIGTPTSMNVYGERRIGKSSLLYHIMQTWQDRVLPDQRHAFVVSYLSMNHAQPQTTSAFFQSLAQALAERPTVQARPELATPLTTVVDDITFSNALTTWKNHQILPVICIDDFEKLLEYPDVFTKNFYDFLRALLDAKKMMVILATKESVPTLRKTYGLTSAFFNLGALTLLEELLEEEADQLVNIPASTIPNHPPLLSVEEQRLAKQWGGRHPYLLQLAGKWLCQARQQHHDSTWAKQHFDLEADHIPVKWRWLKQIVRRLDWVLWIPREIGKFAIRLGSAYDELGATLVGMGIIIVIALIVVGVVQPSFLQQFLP